ncbi:hypothetical protein [Furfurilactobacillus milii]|uniref:hypothetical protein n=1 Tax=Furfurilactobacillus milii TaxID=2888272 RepID=UPI0013C33BC6|nr:hypothetical protein [Furfurilactobacillus milii]
MTKLQTAQAATVSPSAQKMLAGFKYLANYKFNPNKPGNFQWQSVDDGFLMVVD